MSQRQPRVEDPAYLAYVRTLPCLICGRPGSDPAHIRSPSLAHGKPLTGLQRKPDDKWVLPLCRAHHDEQHRHNEVAWWASYGIDPFATAQALYASRPDQRPPRERRRVMKRTRLPREQRRKVGPSRKMEPRSNWPKGRKIQTRAKEAHKK